MHKRVPYLLDAEQERNDRRSEAHQTDLLKMRSADAEVPPPKKPGGASRGDKNS